MGSMATKRIAERVEGVFEGARVDRERGVIVGARLCGLTSQNGRTYSPAAFRKDIDKYNGALIRYDHELRGDAKVESIGGRIRNARVGPDGTPRGDAWLLKSHPMYPRVMEAAESEIENGPPGLMGFSHVADCRTSRVDGREVVEGINHIESVDIVAIPATVKGFYSESSRAGVSRTLIEQFVRHPDSTSRACRAATRLREALESAGVGVGGSGNEFDHGNDQELATTLAKSFGDAVQKAASKFFNRGADSETTLAEIRRLFRAFLDAAGVDDVKAPAMSAEEFWRSRPAPSFRESLGLSCPEAAAWTRELVASIKGEATAEAGDAFARSITGRAPAGAGKRFAESIRK